MADITFTGFITRDPRIEEVGRNDDLVANFTVSDTKPAWDKKKKEYVYDSRDNDNVKQLFHEVSAWREYAELIEKLDLHKGDKVKVTGRATEIRVFEKDDGDLLTSLEVELDGIKALSRNENDEEEEEKPKRSKRSTGSSRSRSKVKDEEPEEDDDDEEEEQEEEKPKRSTSARKSSASRTASRGSGRGAGRRSAPRSFA